VFDLIVVIAVKVLLLVPDGTVPGYLYLPITVVFLEKSYYGQRARFLMIGRIHRGGERQPKIDVRLLDGEPKFLQLFVQSGMQCGHGLMNKPNNVSGPLY
jgi:hypothetical protein